MLHLCRASTEYFYRLLFAFPTTQLVLRQLLNKQGIRIPLFQTKKHQGAAVGFGLCRLGQGVEGLVASSLGTQAPMSLH